MSEFSLLFCCPIQAIWISQPGINNEYFKFISKACGHHTDNIKKTLSDTWDFRDTGCVTHWLAFANSLFTQGLGRGQGLCGWGCVEGCQGGRCWGQHGGVLSAVAGRECAGSEHRAAGADWCVGCCEEGRTGPGGVLLPTLFPHVAQWRKPHRWNCTCWPGGTKHSDSFSKSPAARAALPRLRSLPALAHW